MWKKSEVAIIEKLIDEFGAEIIMPKESTMSDKDGNSLFKEGSSIYLKTKKKGAPYHLGDIDILSKTFIMERGSDNEESIPILSALLFKATLFTKIAVLTPFNYLEISVSDAKAHGLTKDKGNLLSTTYIAKANFKRTMLGKKKN